MSYEGCIRKLCKNGHLTVEDCYLEIEEKCPTCQAPFVWINNVDQTNGSFDESGKRIDGFIELEIAKHDCCDKCGSLLECTYKIPDVTKRLKKGRKMKSEIPDEGWYD